MLIKFDNYKGQGWNNTELVPVAPIEIQNSKNSQHYRKMAPILLADAMTIYKV